MTYQEKAKWDSGVDKEISFWSNWIDTKGREFSHEEFLFRTSNDTQLQDNFKEMIGFEKKNIDILDIGSGPLTVLGKNWDNKTINITAIDPLADNYLELRQRYNLTSSVKINKGFVESLEEIFAPDSFDFIHARNSLDHCWDPKKGIQNIYNLLKPKSKAYISVFINEGEHEKYDGLHQWNFHESEKKIEIWNKNDRFYLDDIIPNLEYEYKVILKQRWIEIVISKYSITDLTVF